MKISEEFKCYLQPMKQSIAKTSEEVGKSQEYIKKLFLKELPKFIKKYEKSQLDYKTLGLLVLSDIINRFKETNINQFLKTNKIKGDVKNMNDREAAFFDRIDESERTFERHPALYIEPNVTYTLRMDNPDNLIPGEFTDGYGKQKFIYTVIVDDVYPPEAGEEHDVVIGGTYAWFLTMRCMARFKMFVYGEPNFNENRDKPFKFKRTGSGRNTDYKFEYE